MSKGTTPRHSKPSEPVTIDLDATDVTPRDEAAADAAPDRADLEREEMTAETEAAAEMEASAPVSPEAGDAGEAPQRTVPPVGRGAADADGSRRSAGRSRLGSVAGGIGGGALAFVVLYGLQAGGILPAPGTGPATTLAGEVAELKGTVDGLAARIDQLPGDGGQSAIATISDRLGTLEQQIGQNTASGTAGQALGEIDAKVAELQKRLDGLAGGEPGVSADPTVIAELRARTDAAMAAAAELKGRADRLDAVVAGLEAKQAEVSRTLGTVAAKVEEPGRDLDMARAIASSGLKTAIDRGGPFAAELEAFASVAPEDPAVAELRDLAAAGVPTRARLVADFPAVADRMISAMNPLPDDAGIVDRLMASARSMVKVRQVGEVEGDSVEAIAARLEARLGDGDLEAALAEWAKLPEPAKAAAAGFGKDLAARARVEKMMRDALLPAAAGAIPAGDAAAAPASPATSN